jgi:hypothetical protein
MLGVYLVFGGRANFVVSKPRAVAIAPKARHSIAAAVRPWIEKAQGEIEAQRADISPALLMCN